jgi:glycosyltransferase involved in cell wall biosynthesis
MVPSQFDEPFGRVILESHLNGIPVVAAGRGGIPYTLGKGGVLVDLPDTVSAYAAAVKNVWSDESLYKELSRSARENARRKEFDCQTQLRAFGAVISSLLTCAGQTGQAGAT